MAATIDIFDTSTMLDAITINQEPTTFLQSTFFPNERVFGSALVTFDLEKRKRRVAAYVSRRSEGQKIEKTVFEEREFKPPYVKPKKFITVGDLLKRNKGEIRWVNGMSQLSAAGQKLQEDFDDLDAMISRTEEQQASQILQTGKLTPLDNDGNQVGLEIDFQRDAANTITLAGGDLWDSGTGKITENLRAWKRIVSIASGIQPTILVLGSAAVDAFMADSEIQSILDNRRMPNENQIAMQSQAMNATFIGIFEGLRIYSYDGIYIDSSSGVDVVTNYVPTNIAILGGPDENVRNYGVIEWMEDASKEVFAAKRLPVSWTEKDPSGRILQVHSAPLLVTKNPDSILKAKVTA